MKRHILLPTDFSDNAWSAMVYAQQLLKDMECSFYILNSIALKASTMTNFSNSLFTIMKENAFRDLNELKQKIESADVSAKHEFHVIVSTLDLFDAIEVEVNRNNIDLVVMGTQGATGAKELFLGSNTVKVIKKIKECPVLIVPDGFKFVVPRQIAFPTGFKFNFSQQELQPLKSMAQLYESKIRIVHINEEEELSKEQELHFSNLKNDLAEFRNSFHWMPDYTKKAKEIEQFIKDFKIDMLAMVNNKRSWIERIILEPVIKKIGFQPSVPFLVIPS